LASSTARTGCCACSTTSACRGRRPAPSHPKADPAAQARFKKISSLIADIGRDHPAAARLEVWFLDEARVGQTGRLCRRWYQKGMRPRGRRDLRHQAAWLFGAVCPERDLGVALVLPTVGAAAMQATLDELSQAVAPGAHAVVLMDRAAGTSPPSSRSRPT
jgi:hypothetical protein